MGTGIVEAAGLVDVRLAVRPGRECAVVEVAGDLDMATAPQVREGLQRVLDDGTRNVVVDLAGVGFMDSSGLGTAVQQQVRSLLAVTSVDRVIGVYDTVLAAEASMPPVVA